MVRSFRQKISKETDTLYDTSDQWDLISTRHYISKNQNILFFKKKISTHGTFSRTDHIQDHKTSLNKFKSTEIMLSIFSDHNGMKVDSNQRGEKKEKNKHVETKQRATMMN